MGSRKFKADVSRSVAFGSITASYGNLGAALTEVLVMMTIKNTTDVTLWVSEDGSTDHYEIPSGTMESFDFQANTPDDKISGKSVGTQFEVKAASGALPASGNIILEGQYL